MPRAPRYDRGRLPYLIRDNFEIASLKPIGEILCISLSMILRVPSVYSGFFNMTRDCAHSV